jgi:hypothetical protein
MPILVTDPIIRVGTRDGTCAVGLQDVFALAKDGNLIDLPGMRADQRAPVVTALAIISHLLRRYSSSLTTPERNRHSNPKSPISAPIEITQQLRLL